MQAAASRLVERASSELEARSTGSHCGGLTTAWSASTSLLATQGFVVFGMKAAQKAVATPMRTSAWKREVCFFAYKLRSGGRMSEDCEFVNKFGHINWDGEGKID